MRDFVDSIRWPQVALLAIILTAALVAIIFVPEAKWHVIPWQSIAGGITLIGGAVVGLFMKPAVDPTKPAEIAARRASSTPPNREAGFVDVRLLYFIGAIGCLFAGCALLPGCGANALQIHSTTAVIATTLETSAKDVYTRHLEAAFVACGEDVACKEAADTAHRPAEAALAIVGEIIDGYEEGIAIANEADVTGDILSALVTSALRLVAHWDDLVAAFALLDIELPRLPFQAP